LKNSGTVALAFVVLFAALFFFMLSSCALSSSVPATDREGAAVFALVDAGVIVAGIWGIRRLNLRK
jgi:hypothetical protein